MYFFCFFVFAIHCIGHDSFHIPYDHLHGITLITILRLGLIADHKERAYKQFIQLPLYEDMAPWNVAFSGSNLYYIDFDTRDITFDKVLPLAYQVMSVLFNYKRTVEDFGHCGQKASNAYGFPFVSDCVGSNFKGPCKESLFPVPCGDGKCHSDYIDCLRALLELEDSLGSNMKDESKLKEIYRVADKTGMGTSVDFF
jgi:hypothetical protein